MAGLGQKLEIRQGQGLVMTPQLQQAIKLLQMNNMELTEFVEAELEKNPLLERDERSDAPAEEPERAEKTRDSEELSFEPKENGKASEALDADSDTLYSDSGSDMVGSGSATATGPVDWSRAGKGGSFEGEDYDPGANSARAKTLHEHLHDQLAELAFVAADRMMAAHLIDLADDDGYMRADLDETAEKLGVTRSELEAILDKLQTFEPAGVLARSLQECLALQLREQRKLDPFMAALIDHLPLLAKHDYPGLQAACGVDAEDLDEMIAELRALTPKPGLAFGTESTRGIEADVFVRQSPDGGWAVELNTDTLPRVLVNNRYMAEISRAAKGDETAKEFVSECAQNASWLVKSLDQRARTILKVTSEIVRQQDAFLVKGVAWLRPLNLKTVADAVGLHESTVSRVTSNKYAATPRGLFELKYFFTSSIASADGGEAYSAEAVRYRIKAMIDGETAEDVMSDDKIVDRLLADGIEIARRTVAKYREAMNIPSSVQRRRILKRAG